MSRKLRVAVVGLKGMGQGHIKAIEQLKDMFELAAVCDIDPQQAKACSDRLHVPGYLDLTPMLSTEKLDAVALATPHPFHASAAIACAKAGVHMLTEKPMAVAVSEAEAMTKAHAKAKTVLSVVFQSRYDPLQRTVHDLIRKGAIGEIFRAALTATGFRTTHYYHMSGWRGTWKGEAGGVLVNQAPHQLDQFCWLVGMMPKTLYAKCETFLHPIETEDRAAAILTFPNGALGTIVASTTDSPGVTRYEIVGDKGGIIIEGGKARLGLNKTPVRQFLATSKEEWGSPGCDWTDIVPVKPEGWITGHAACFYQFGKQILGEPSEYVPGEEGMKGLELADAMILSSHRGEPVKLPLSRKEYDKFLKDMIAKAQRKQAKKGK